MARINLDDTLWCDTRFMRFSVKIGDEARAIGYLVIAFKLAQKHWCPEKRPVPLAEWSISGLPRELIECGLAEEKEDGIYVKGSEQQFAWWFQRKKAGESGGRPPKHEESERKRPVSPVKRNQSKHGGSNPLTLSSLSSSEKEKNISFGDIPKEKTPADEAKEFFESTQSKSEPYKHLLGILTEKFSGAPPAAIAAELDKFAAYWTEPTKNGIKQRWELQKVFEIRRRLATWFNNASDKLSRHNIAKMIHEDRNKPMTAQI